MFTQIKNSAVNNFLLSEHMITPKFFKYPGSIKEIITHEILTKKL